ncbi:quercetin 2,3-dioxygenase [Aureococcus anophagefferens]|nr:quercetin 2,3-dioxygenase [Aureococcus anophagefferens]
MAVLRVDPLTFPFDTDSPFLFGVFHNDKYPKATRRWDGREPPGHNIGAISATPLAGPCTTARAASRLPKHPHRGFETISVSVRGFVDHVDSLGGGRAAGGGVQWMTAGAGISHAEMFPCLARAEENHMEFFQIWLNLPRAKKMSPPNFLMFWGEDIPTLDRGGALVKLVAGAVEGFSKPALPPPPDSYARDPNSQLLVMTINGRHRNLYKYEGGELTAGGKRLTATHRIKVDASKDLEVTAGAGDRAPRAPGRRLEPVVQHGPFVGNTREDITKAFRDYQMTQFGSWPWPSDGVVHKRRRRRQVPRGASRRSPPRDAVTGG